jgi:hypothetical protein
MPIPGQDKDITDNEGNYPNTPNQWLLRNLFGGMQIGWSAGGASPTSFNIAYPTVPSTSFLIPWVPGPAPGGFQPTNIFIGNGTSGTTETFNGNNGTNGSNGSADPISCRFYDSSSNEVIVEPVTQIFFNFPDGEVTDQGGGVVQVEYNTTGGAAGNLTATLPVVVTPPGSMTSNKLLSLNYDSTDSFALSGGSTLALKTITVTAPADAGAVTGITVDGYGRTTAYARQFHGVYKITASTRTAGYRYWFYTMLEQVSNPSAWPFFSDGTNQVYGLNFYETCNTGSQVYGNDASSAGTANVPIPLDDFTGFTVGPAPTGLIVEVWKWGTHYYFSAPNVIDGACP